ncbi:alpha-1,2-fucosyltransferase [Geomonas subterranea]|uniref:Alpha-1,2-fucosyltransferase n=1 Tax=Geomonas subterranea TaxID=2847989 RepID=A0ABX8LFU9_9BACT|nr:MULTISPECIES: alpha-1,2-fucosyltransferase [Geomonas]QXE90921.1 alpha-1,2-fucosyltransferase [Geomonas subterranea]QXM10993.1 alpha-1,2-fucosyltransferase [Geomonas subterranea]
MVIVRAYNGLGNQMFQYALGRHLAVLNGTELKIDTGAFADDPLREYELHRFKVRGCIASAAEVAHFREMETVDPQHYLRLMQKSRLFDPAVLEARGNIYLHGFWQTERYFAGIRELLLDEFQLEAPPGEGAMKMLGQIEASNAVALHVRRSDYVTNPKTTLHHGVLPLEYYEEAMRRMAAMVPDPVFFIFSDDPQWARENITPPGPSVCIDGNDAWNGHEDLWLMRNCKHFIIANSSFSWWGAWLSGNADKRVIAPLRWFAKPEIDTRDIVPPQWMRI